MSQFEFGYAQEDITPAYGADLQGYFNERLNKGAYDRLSLKAAVFRTGNECAAIVSYDLCLFTGKVVEQFEELLKQSGSPLAGKTLYCCTHTHTGPYTSDLFGHGADQEYLEELKQKTVYALNKAYKSLAPAELYATETECSTLAFNRRYIMKNGKTLTNPGKLNPEIDHSEGGIDSMIPILQIRQHDRPVMLLVNISNHTDTIGGNYVSADWPGAMEKEIQRAFDYQIPVMEITAPQGNINHFDVSTMADQTSYAEAKRIGKGYANVILAALFKLKKQENINIQTAVREFEAPYLQLTDEEYAEAKQTFEENKDAVMEAGRDFTSEDIARGVPAVKKFFAERAIQCRENPIKEKRIEKQLKIAFNDEIAIVSLPAEPFVEIGEAIREGSKYPLTILAALGMGEIGYVGMPWHYGNGGYETSPSRSLADRHVGEAMIEGALELLK
ncbi:MAG: hypothetical protein IKB25_12405 [Lentisphaeria bacterium]|nr:hypothetical protein [Lentisphaeria bacterium]